MKNRLKVLRAERNWSQARLADLLDVSFKMATLFACQIEDIFEPDTLEMKH